MNGIRVVANQQGLVLKLDSELPWNMNVGERKIQK
jgi:hypothetical protein